MPVVESLAVLAPAVAVEVDRRRARLAASAPGPLLDLRDPEARAEVAAAAVDGGHTGAYATVLSAFDLVRFPDLFAALAGIAGCLTPEGELRFVEPVQRPGALGVVLATAWSRHPAVAGLHLQRDLAATARAAGFTVTEIERFTMPTPVWPLRHFAEGAARRFPTPPASDRRGGGDGR